MSDIEALESRLPAALERIGKGIELLSDQPAEAPAAPEPPQEDPATEALKAALEDERMANAQLQERVAMLRRKAEEGAAESRKLAEVQADKEAVEEAYAKLQAEYETLKEAQASDREELESILSAMQPLLEEA